MVKIKKILIFLITVNLIIFSSCSANIKDDIERIQLITEESCFVDYDWYETTSNFNYKLKFKNQSSSKLKFSIEGVFEEKDFGKLEESNCLYALNLNDDNNNVFMLQAKEEKTFVVSFDYQNFDDGEEIKIQKLPKINIIKPLEIKESNQFIYTANNGATATITDYKGDTKELTIPSTIGGYTVTRVTGLGNKNFEKITFSEGIKELKDCCSNLGDLEKVVLPESLERIIGETLLICEKLTDISIPKNVEEIDICVRNGGDNEGEDLPVFPFDGCTSLKSINIDENNEFYKSVDGVLYDFTRKALIKCPEAKQGKVILPDWALEVDYYDDLNQSAFANCKFIETVVLPEKFGSENDYGKYFYGDLFPGCESLKNIIVNKNNPYFKSIDGNLYKK